MCCFSGKVASVSGTNIFARGLDSGRQLLAYGMTVSADDPVAMILPLPVPPKSTENALRWIDLKGYPELFSDLKSLFPIEVKLSAPPPTVGVSLGALEVAEVGDFEASFVPTLKDFSRLDARFRLSDTVWKALPQYADYGFAVFKLKAGAANTVHPMAFEFPRRDPKHIFFPTVHVHDGAVHPIAEFDHTLYLQSDSSPESFWDRLWTRAWEESARLPKGVLKLDKASGLVLPDAHVYRHRIRGTQKNQDTVA